VVEPCRVLEVAALLWINLDVDVEDSRLQMMLKFVGVSRPRLNHDDSKKCACCTSACHIESSTLTDANGECNTRISPTLVIQGCAAPRFTHCELPPVKGGRHALHMTMSLLPLVVTITELCPSRAKRSHRHVEIRKSNPDISLLCRDSPDGLTKLHHIGQLALLYSC
jgi:hypothetical protein